MALRERLTPWLLPSVLTAVAWLWIGWLHMGGVGRPTHVAPLVEAQFQALDPPTSDPGAGSWRRVRLPHDWAERDPEVRRGRYRLDVVVPEAPVAGLGLYFPSLNPGARIRVNGHPVGRDDAFHGIHAHYWHVPSYVAIPAPLLRTGANRIVVDVEPDAAGAGYVAPPFLGAHADVRPAYEVRHFLQVSGIQILVIAMLAFGAFLALLHVLRPKDPAYLWFAVVNAVFAFGFYNLLAIDAWLPKPNYRWVGAVTMAWLAVAIAIFVNRFLGEVHRRLELFLLGGVAAGSLYFAVTLGTPLYRPSLVVWAALVLAVGAYSAVRVARSFARRATRELQLVVTSGLLIFTAGAHDVLLVNGPVPLEHDFAIVWAAALSIAIFALLFVNRFIVALDTSEALTAELEQRVADKAAELDASYRSLQALEEERAVARERERLMAEIHDGMGGQLVSTLAMLRGGEAEPEDVEAALRAALDDMRLVIHSLDAGASDLPTLLGMLRARLGPRLEKAGIRLRWQVEDVPAIAGFGPEGALHLMRIVQEAITNVVKHAEASSLTVATGVEDGHVFVALADDGRGLGVGAETSGGIGLSSMRRRAERIGAELRVVSQGRGTVVHVRLPAA